MISNELNTSRLLITRKCYSATVIPHYHSEEAGSTYLLAKTHLTYKLSPP